MNNLNTRVLMLEDDMVFARLLQRLLGKENFIVDIVNDCQSIWGRNLFQYQIFILDIRLPDGNGIDVCKELREITSAPILFLTASDDEESIVRGLQEGGDDYLTKPFRSKELIARMNALLRRYKSHKKIVKSGELVWDTERHTFQINGNDIILTVIETILLELLLQHPKSFISRTYLLDRIWNGKGEAPEDNSLSVYIGRLRKKLKVFWDYNAIDTSYGKGYRWNLMTEEIDEK